AAEAAEAPAAEAAAKPAAEATAAPTAEAAEKPAVEPAAEAVAPPAAETAEKPAVEAAVEKTAPVVEAAPVAEVPEVEPEVTAAPAPAPAPAAAAPEAAPAAAPAKPDVAALVSEIDTLEKLRRQALEAHGRTSLSSARAALRKGEYTEAQKLYEEALKFIGARPGNEEVRDEAVKGVAEAIYRQAGVLWKKGDREAAIQLARQARERGHPKAPRMVAALQHEIDHPPEPKVPKDPKRWTTDDYQKERETATRGLAKAREYYITGEYDEARAQLELILRDNPYDMDAMQMLKRVNERAFDTSTSERDTTRSKMIRDVRDTWNPRRYAIDTVEVSDKKMPTQEGQPVGKGYKTPEQTTIEKMQAITIPEINFRAANINDVIAFFETASREFDSPDTPPEKRGVSFVLKLAGGSTPAPPVADDPFATPAATAAGGVSPVTFSARYVTLYDALKIVTDVAGLKFRVRGTVVMVMPINVPDMDLVTRSYTVLPSLKVVASSAARELSTPARGGDGGDFLAAAEVPDTGRVDWKQFFQDMGILWPDGSSISYNENIGKLRVSNTPENLAALEQLLEELNVTPRQIEIESRFVEVSQTDLESIGFEWLLTDDWEIAHKEGALSPFDTQRIVAKAGSGTPNRLRYLDNQGINATLGPVDDAVLGVASVLTNPELSFVLHLLSQRQNTDLLSAPKVVTKNNQEAIIKVVTEFIYPTEYTVNEGSAASGGDAGGASAVGATVEPGSFEMREVGVILQVVPEVSPDGQMIDLLLNPQIVSEPEWKDYGFDTMTMINDQIQTMHLPMEQPFFKVRSISTRISIYNGATVVMGGMITEVRNEVDDKIPVLGDIPLLGRLFRSRHDHSEKRNLLIFVTARLVDPAGRSLKTQQDAAGATAETAGAPVAAQATP
ncbi:MAG: hypothetical protein PHR35_06390, partial [Kiritimatiellae bacterium]|nr:hypothetical protein [Kiritimatiellia bacterium]